MKFEPFQDRMSRIIRNELGETISEVLAGRDILPAQQVAEKFFEQDLEPYYQEYIRERIDRYSAVVKRLDTVPNDLFWQALVLWDQQLFFEVHEILEKAWMRSDGTEKKNFQAMIRAAGVYIKLEFGYTDAAQKIARKAVPVLEKHSGFLADYFDPEILLTALRQCSLPPPRLLAP